MRHSILRRAAACVLAAVMAAAALTVGVSAVTPASHTVFTGERLLEGWYPSFITQYQQPDAMDSFITAIKNDGAAIEVEYTGNAEIGLLLQSYPVKDGSQNYPHASIGGGKVTEKNGHKLATFEAAKLIEKYTSTKHPDDGSNLSLSNVLNFGVGGSGDTVYSIVVRWEYPGDPSLDISLDKEFQTITGWGASYTWYGDWVEQNNSREQVFDWIFNDCGFNILRFRDLQMVRAYGGDWESTDYANRAYKLYYDAAKKRGIDPIVVVTSWGEYKEADWCTLSKDADGNEFYTLKKDSNGNYRYEDLAQFYVKSVQQFKDAGIPIDYYSISNEVELQQFRVDEQGNARSDGGFFLGPEETQYYCSYAKAYIATYKAFQKAFGSSAPKLLAAETMAANPELLKRYIDPIIRECPESVTDVAHHLYGSNLTAENFSKIADEYYGKYGLWQTEWYNNDFFGHASVMINELINENLNAYLYWNGFWIPDDAKCLIEVGDWAPSSYVSRRGNHYIMMHFSRFIKAGYKRVGSSVRYANTKAAAFKSPDGEKLVIVALNDSETDETLNINLGAKVEGQEIWRTTRRTKDVSKEIAENVYMQKTDEKAITDGGTLKIPANTLTTYVLDISAGDPVYGQMGDLNGDGYLNVSDGIIMQKILARVESGKKYPGADLDGDGMFTVADGIAMQKLLAGFKI